MAYKKAFCEVLGTKVSLSLDCENGEIIQQVFNEFRRIEKEFSRFLKGNQLWELNNSLNKECKVSDELYFLLEQAKNINETSKGAFDVSIESVLKSLGYDGEYSFETKGFGQTGSLELLAEGKVKITAPIDLGGLGKGYALDKCVKILEDYNNFLIDLGGDLYAKGKNESKAEWKVLFEHPFDDKKAIGSVKVDGFFLASSAAHKRKWRNFHHLIDPSEKKSAQNMAAVYVQADSGLVADAYATALFVLGYEKAKEMLGELPVEAMLISPQGNIHLSENFKGDLF